jgi:hypothetical protein
LFRFIPWHNIAYVAFLLFCACTSNTSNSNSQSKKWPDRFGFGEPASLEKIASIDIDIRPDGKGLPYGSGKAVDGRKVYAKKCAACHGITGAEGPLNRLVTTDTSKAKTIGNYWPYATTVYDYIRRAMPFNEPGSLTDSEVFELTAYLLFANKIIDSTRIIDSTSLPHIEMPARRLFVPDDRTGGKEIR